ncbi:MAG: gliding motility protein GldM [Bacteroidales bacterium]|nr:gliding motility protein GldM [Bacteroidales bacterium]
MGATNCPETPRQRMISMMYLVYTALLALNVSVEILQAFVTVGDSMEITNELFSTKIDNSYYSFEKAYLANPEKVGPNWEKAKQVRKETKEINNYIDGIKYELVAVVEGLKGGKEEAKKMLAEKGYEGIKAKDDYSVPTQYFIGGTEDGTGAKAMELRKTIEAYQDRMQKLSDPKFLDKLKKMQINTKATYLNRSGQKLNWQQYNFNQTITLADLVILNKFKSEIQNAEFDLVNHLLSSVSADDYKFDNVRAKVVPTATYVMQGTSYEAQVFVAAYDSKTQLTADVRGANLVSDSGVIKLKFPAGAVGLQKYQGTVYVKGDKGDEPYPFSGEYFVAAPAVTISPTNMNVFYIGVDNPVSISAPGTSFEQLVPSITGGGGATIKKVSPGNYIVNVKTQQDVIISVDANINGKNMKQGAMKFRVKQIPKPKAVVGSSDGGRIAKEILVAQGGLKVVMDGFDFPVRYDVVEFQMTFNTGGDGQAPLVARGSRFTPEMISQIQRLRRGNKVYIEGIRAKGPDGEKSVQNPQMIFVIQ